MIQTARSASPLAISGNLTLQNTSVLDLTRLAGGFDGTSYTIATFTGSLTGRFNSVTGLAANYQLNYNANSITVTPTPEPAELALVCGGLGALMLRNRKSVRNH